MIVDLDDNEHYQALLHKFADPSRGIIHVQARAQPNPRSLFPINRAIARAYGKRTDRPGWIDERTRFALQLRAWVSGENCRLLIISRAQHLDGSNWMHVAELADLANVEPWLLVQGTTLNRGQRTIAARLGASDASFQTLERRLRALNPKPSTPAAPVQQPFPAVPQSEFFRFLHDCRCLLNNRDYEQVRSVFRLGRQEIEAWRSRGAGNESDLASLLRGTLPAGDPSRALTWLRGTQGGLLGSDLQLWVGLDRLSHLMRLQPIAHLTPQIAQELRTIFGSPWACAALVAIVVGPDLELIARLTLSDISPDGSRVTAHGHNHQLPPYARGILRAHLALRRGERAHQKDPFFAARGKSRRDRSRRLDADGIWDLLKAVADTTGLAVLPPWSPREAESPIRWAARHGIHIRRVYAEAERVG